MELHVTIRKFFERLHSRLKAAALDGTSGRDPVRCETCPRWRFHCTDTYKMDSGRFAFHDQPTTRLHVDQEHRTVNYQLGICARSRPQVFNQQEIGLALRLMAPDDFCSLHPLFPAAGSADALRYDPPTLDPDSGPVAGFNRVPTLAEAIEMARVMGDGRSFVDGAKGEHSAQVNSQAVHKAD